MLIAALAVACGKRGAPLAPLNLMPEPPSALTGKRVNATVYVQMIAPKRNANGPGVVALDHLEVYAVTLRPGLMIPANRELLVPQYLVGQIAIKPPPDEDQESQETEKDTRPGPGEPVTFAEELTEKQLQTSAGLKPMPPPPAPSRRCGKGRHADDGCRFDDCGADGVPAAAPTAAAPAQTPPAVVAPGEQIPITEPRRRHRRRARSALQAPPRCPVFQPPRRFRRQLRRSRRRRRSPVRSGFTSFAA